MSTVQQEPAARPHVTEHAVVARTIAYAAAAGAACLWTADPDLWGHTRFGIDAIRDGGLTSVDPYSFTSDVPWINHEWLSEVAMGAAYLAGAVPGLLALKVVLAAATFGLLGWHARHAAMPARWWVMAAAAVLTLPVTITLRPQLWTALLLAILTTTTGWPVRRLAFLWPVVFAIWANVHGGWIVGLGVVGAWALGTTIDTRDWSRALRLAGLWSMCLAATLVTPYGIHLWQFIAETVGVNREDISEWQSVLVEGAGLWFGSLVLVAVLLWRASWSWAAALPVLMLALGSARVGRLGALWVIVAVGLLLPRWRGQAPALRFQPALVAIIGAVALVPALVLTVSEVRCLPSVGWHAPDFEAAGSLRGASGRLMVPFGWGQFAIWHFGPQLKVSFDGRRETVYSAERIAEQHALVDGEATIAPFIQREHPEYVWIPRPKGEALAAHLETSGCRADVTTPRSIILARSDLPVLPYAPMSGCFP
jgi:hypothetical protein